ncbi:MAG: LysM repeat protein [Candidatus Saccharimonadales bacterium]|jgi:LysM repeat protein
MKFHVFFRVRKMGVNSSGNICLLVVDAGDIFNAKGVKVIMRNSVLTGVFTCAVIFVLSSAKAGAAPLNIDIVASMQPEESAVELLVAVNENPPEPIVLIEETVEEPIEVIHTVKEDETLSKIAKQHDVEWQRIFSKNVSLATPDVISEGDKLIIPGTEEVLEERVIPEPVVIIVPKPTVSVASSSTVQSVSAPLGSSVGNRYTAGNCTWYAKSRRPDMPNNLGNAATWVSRAASQGLATGGSPRAGAIGQRGNHVVYVESVNADGTVNISEMNYRALYAVTTRTVAPTYFSYIY